MAPRTAQQTDAWAEERRAAGMSDEEINYMRNGGRTPLAAGGFDNQDGDDQIGDEDTGDQGDGQGDGQDEGGDQTQQQTRQQSRDDDEDEGDVTLNQPIPYQRYRREQRRLRERLTARDTELETIRNQLNESNTRFARLDERLRLFQEAAQASDEADQTAEVEQVPDANEDPIAAINYLLKKANERTDEVAQVRQRQDTSEAMNAMQSAYTADARQFVSQQPAFPEAYRWLITMRQNQLRAAGFTDENEIANIINNDERDLVARAFTDRQNNPQAAGPAQRLYNFAVASGFRPSQQPTRQNGNGRQQTNQTRQQNRTGTRDTAQPLEFSVSDTVDAIERGRTASRSLSGTGGAPVRRGVNLDELITMSDEEYAHWLRTLSPSQRRQYNQMLGAPERGSLR